MAQGEVIPLTPSSSIPGSAGLGRPATVTIPVIILPSNLRVFYDDAIAPRPNLDVLRHLDRLAYRRASCRPSAVEVQGHHRHHSDHAGAWHRRDDGDLLHGLFADVE